MRWHHPRGRTGGRLEAALNAGLKRLRSGGSLPRCGAPTVTLREPASPQPLTPSSPLP